MGKLILKYKHKVMCNDSTVKENIDHLMGGEKADMIFTDPPYDISAEGKYNNSYKVDAINASEYEKWDKGFKFEKLLPLLTEFIHNKGNIFVFSSSYHCWKTFLPYLFDKFEICMQFIWAKKFAVSNVRQVGFAKSYEPAVYAWNKGHIFNAKKGLENYDVQYFASNEGGRSYDHPTSKPVALCKHIIELLSNDLVLDFFLGSGSTLIACEKTNRRCFGMELDEHYVDVILNRYLKFTDNQKDIILEENHKTFEEIKKERLGA